MQHASILYRQRAIGSMRVLRRATVTRLAIPGPEVSKLLSATTPILSKKLSSYIIDCIDLQTSGAAAAENIVLPSRCQESSSRGLHADMSTLCHARDAGHRTLWSGCAHR